MISAWAADNALLRTSQHARYFGAELDERTLVPGDDARLAETRFDDWLSQARVSTP